MPHRRTFLDINASATGQRWAERLEEGHLEIASRLNNIVIHRRRTP
jgi:hypothetical protein